MWAVGCIFAEIILRTPLFQSKTYFIYESTTNDSINSLLICYSLFYSYFLTVLVFASGETELDLLGKIFNVFGTPTAETWPSCESLPQYRAFESRDPLDLRSLFPVTASSPAMVYYYGGDTKSESTVVGQSGNGNGSVSSPKWSPLVYNRYYSTGVSMALDLLLRMLTLDPMKRISAVDALTHPYFTTNPLPCLPQDVPKPLT